MFKKFLQTLFFIILNKIIKLLINVDIIFPISTRTLKRSNSDTPDSGAIYKPIEKCQEGSKEINEQNILSASLEFLHRNTSPAITAVNF